MPATTIHFVRHGEVFNPGHLLYERLPGFHLSVRGLGMARAAAAYLTRDAYSGAVTAVYSSPLERAVETADVIVDALNAVHSQRNQQRLCVRTDASLIEAGNKFRGTRVGFGDGALWRHGNWRLLAHPSVPSWGESYRHIAWRMQAFARRVAATYPDGRIVVVSHESPIWTLRRVLETGRPEHYPWNRRTALGSITTLTLDCDSRRLLGVDYVDPSVSTRQTAAPR